MYCLCIVCKILKDRESVRFVHHCVLCADQYLAYSAHPGHIYLKNEFFTLKLERSFKTTKSDHVIPTKNSSIHLHCFQNKDKNP